jgi:single-strand DNA-binding protein
MSRGINKVILVGNLGKDPEMNHLDNGVAVAKFSLATSESYTNKEGQRVDQTEWHNIVLWRGLAEIADKYLRKGSRIYLEGKLRYRSYEDKDNIKRYSTEIVGDQMVMLDGRSEGEGQGGYTQRPSGAAQSASGQPAMAPTAMSSSSVNESQAPSQGSAGDYEDDLPF